MSIDSTWFRCPNCFLPLAPVTELTLGYDTGHRFDVSRHGTVTLLPPRAPNTVGDTREMLDARARLLGSGLFQPIVDAIAQAAVAVSVDDSPARIVDLGCGTGYYAARVAEVLPGTVLAADRSPIAVRLATRSIPRASGVVLDLWKPLPLRDAVADIALNVFAPRNPSEFARILSPQGRLIVVVPTPVHLQELRHAGALLDIPEGKAERVVDQFTAVGLSLHHRTAVEYTRDASAATRAELAGMGPSAHHVASLESTSQMDDRGARSAVTISVDVLVFRPPAPAA